MSRHVVVVSNDIVPGMGLPVAAPGLRAWGIAEGLRALGHEVTLVVDAHVVMRTWGLAFPPPRRGCLILTPQQAGDLIRTRRPDAVVVTNSNHLDALGDLSGTRLVYDFFAPKVLELAEHPAGDERERAMAQLVSRKLRGLARADAVLVNGAKKLPYVDDWLARAGAEDTPTRVVIMPVPTLPPSSAPAEGPVHAVVSGYLQPWSNPGEWAEAVMPHLEDGSMVLHLLVANHWGSGSAALELPEIFRRLASAPGVRTHGAMEFEPFHRLLNTCQISIDLFSRNPERELAMVTRTMVAVAAGLATVHVPFTETSELVAEHDAGWLVDPEDHAAVAAALQEAVCSRELLAAKRAGAASLAEQMEPRHAVAPLARLLEEELA